MISIWANFNAQSFIHPKLSMQSSELFLYVSTCLQQQWPTTTTTYISTQLFQLFFSIQLYLLKIHKLL